MSEEIKGCDKTDKEKAARVITHICTDKPIAIEICKQLISEHNLTISDLFKL